MATQDKWEKQHLKSIAKYERLIKQIYDKYVQEAARIGADITSFDASNPLAFDDYPLTRKRIEALQKHMASDIEAVVYNGIDEQWALADGKTSALIATAFAGLSAEELEERKAKYLTNRDDAREAFKTRKENGMNISDRVWRYTDQFKEEMEMGIDLGLRDGKSADALSRDLRKYLNNPDMLFRRVRDEHGMLHLSKRAKAYHPGQGVYRSSYKNARRLAATETNIAYRTADHDRVQDLDFVVGIRVNLSNNHTLNGEPFTDICDELSAPFGSKATKGKGCYPKDFKFTGWHPLCRCFITTILKTEEEMDADDERIMSGDEPADPSESKNYIEDVPGEFKTWVKKNGARVVRSQSLPYFMQDNSKIVAKVFHEGQPSTNLSRNLLTTIPYMNKYAERDPRVAAILNELDDNGASMKDFEQAMLANRLKTICANITYADMRKAGLLGDDMIMARLERDFVVQSKVTYTTTSGKPISIREAKRDMIILRDKYGRKFAYPVGTDSESMLISPKAASETFNSLPRFLTKDMDRVSFYNMACPVDDYWKVEYRSPNHTSAATDGGRTSFWETTKGMTDEQFKRIMAHEAAHWLDTRYGRSKWSNSKDWNDAVKADIELAKANRGGAQMYPTDYAKTNLREDFAESMALFLTDRRKLKEIAPNRERYLHDLSKQLGDRLRY